MDEKHGPNVLQRSLKFSLGSKEPLKAFKQVS